jgi:quinol monooxygenase YgiN
MIDIVCIQRINPGMEERVERLLQEAEKETLAHDKGCERYEWHRGSNPNTYVLIERWSDREAVQAHLRLAHMERLLKAG